MKLGCFFGPEVVLRIGGYAVNEQIQASYIETLILSKIL